MSKDRYNNVLLRGLRVVDLRDDSKKTGIVMSTMAIEKVLIKWDNTNEEEWLDGIDVVQTDRIFR